MGRKKKATLIQNQQAIPSSIKPSEGKNPPDSPSVSSGIDPTKQELSELSTQYTNAKTETDPKTSKSTVYRSKKADALAEEEKKRADIQTTGEAFGDAYCVLLDMLMKRMPHPQEMSETEKLANSQAMSRVAVKYIGVDFKYKEEIILLTVTAVTLAPRLMKGKD